MGFKTECARECLHAAVSHTTLFNTILDQTSHIGFVETQDQSIDCDIRAQNPTQDFLMLTIGDCLRKQAHQSITYFSAMIIQ